MKPITLTVGLLAANCYLLCSAQGNCAIIDPGANPKRIAREIAAAGLSPKMILLTHGHHDHFGAAKELLRQFPNIPLYIGEEDLELLKDPVKSYASTRTTKLENFLIDEAQGLSDGEELLLDELTVQVMHTPGHTKGSVVYLCKDSMFSGDTLFLNDCGNCDFYGGSFAKMKASLKELAELSQDYIIYPGHGPSTTLSFERENNPYMPIGLQKKK